MLKMVYGHIHFVVKNLDIADELADKIEGKHLGDTDIYKDKGKIIFESVSFSWI